MKRRLRLVGESAGDRVEPPTEGEPVRCAIAGAHDDHAAHRFAEMLREHARTVDPDFDATTVAVGAAHLPHATLTILVTGPTHRSTWPASRRALRAVLELAEPREEVARGLAPWLVRGLAKRDPDC